MRYEITSDKCNFSFNKNISPAIKVNTGDEVVFHTRDAHNGTVPEGKNVMFPDIALNECNPITGPVYVNNAEPGDILKVKIKDIELSASGYIPARKKMGIIKGLVQKNIARNMQIKNGFIHFSPDIKVPVRPMIGTIGVVPKNNAVSSAYAGVHGGNMDNNDVRKGAIIYLPVFFEGALLSVGDVHASMGDGELTSGGVDTCAKVVLELYLVKNRKIDYPIIETEDAIVLTSNDMNFFKANWIITRRMISLLKEYLDIESVEAYWLISICGDLKISQACNCPIGVTLRISFPKSILLAKKKKFI